jgi:hypothetical protein
MGTVLWWQKAAMWSIIASDKWMLVDQGWEGLGWSA